MNFQTPITSEKAPKAIGCYIRICPFLSPINIRHAKKNGMPYKAFAYCSFLRLRYRYTVGSEIPSWKAISFTAPFMERIL